MAEIEIEKKFLLTTEQEQQLLDGAEFSKEKKIVDSYFDDAEYSLTAANYWLRSRDGEYELKAPLLTSSGAAESTNRYRELTTDEEIAEELGFTGEDSLSNELSRLGITAFIEFTTTRQSYKKQGFTIDIDSATYANSNFTYGVAEIELMAEDESQADAVEEKILAFAKEHGLTTDKLILGKVGAYLEAEKPDHYRQLVEAGVLK